MLARPSAFCPIPSYAGKARTRLLLAIQLLICCRNTSATAATAGERARASWMAMAQVIDKLLIGDHQYLSSRPGATKQEGAIVYPRL